MKERWQGGREGSLGEVEAQIAALREVRRDISALTTGTFEMPAYWVELGYRECILLIDRHIKRKRRTEARA